jgi:hypothetical protein
MNNPKILFLNHTKLYILLKDKITFESEMEKRNVDYYCDLKNLTTLENGNRYLIQNIDRIKVDGILIENGIIAETETIQVSDYRDGKKAMNIYLKIAGIVFGIMILIIIIEKIIK